ncbi:MULTISPECIES: CHASE3 domain-containing protein [unclassified Massilia]|uniref:CHASE3 domain-containing protein n=1 Tax=unclassified Massilia TaxID=2609279 RepID=UPI001E3C7C76|nr:MULTISPECIES: CHASE3 domain-containing protein [unclassified Massilia]
MTGSSLDNRQFHRILKRNVALPLGMSVLSAGVFVAIVAFMINVLNWVEHSQQVIGNANEVSKLVSDMEAGMRGYLISGDESFLGPYTVARPKVEIELDNLQRLINDNPDQANRLNQVRSAHREWLGFATEMIERRRTGRDVVESIRGGRGKVLTDEMRSQFSSFIASERSLLQQRSQSARTVITWSVGAFLLFTLIGGGLLAAFGRRELLRLSTSYDEVLKHESEHNAELRHLSWLRTGQAELAAKSLGLNSLELLAQAVLDHVVRYLGGAVAAMYVRNEDGTLRRIGAFGFSNEDEHAKTIESGSSLASQAANENRLLRVKELPGDYIKVSSSLGETAPREIVIAPFSNFGKVKGVMEVGFLQPVRERDLEFLRLVGDAVGASVAAIVYRSRLQDALSESQALNEELQVQQEELRTANEELEEQSRALEESQSSLENQQAELEQTNDQLAEQAMNLDMKNAALVEAQEQLRARALDLERASRYKSEFLANMSHELRTPLNSSLILAKLLADNVPGNLNEEQVRFAQTIYSAGNDLLHLINDILDISKVEAGKLELLPEDLPIRRTVEGLGRTFEPLAKQKDLRFTVAVEPNVPPTLHTDRQRLEQVLKNLLSNAVKFTEQGEVNMTVSATQEGWIQFTVTDTGIGIPPEQHERIFEAFHQADGTTNRRFGGTGLGLSISRDLTGLLGGTLVVSSTPARAVPSPSACRGTAPWRPRRRRRGLPRPAPARPVRRCRRAWRARCRHRSPHPSQRRRKWRRRPASRTTAAKKRRAPAPCW